MLLGWTTRLQSSIVQSPSQRYCTDVTTCGHVQVTRLPSITTLVAQALPLDNVVLTLELLTLSSHINAWWQPLGLTHLVCKCSDRSMYSMCKVLCLLPILFENTQ